jgi:hypothetical protein
MARNYYLTLLLFWQLHPEKIKHISDLLQSRNSPVKVRKYGIVCVTALDTVVPYKNFVSLLAFVTPCNFVCLICTALSCNLQLCRVK